MVCALHTFLEFVNLARQNTHNTKTLKDMETVLEQFHQYWECFVEAGVHLLQHSLMHYIKSICLFGSPNGLCTSITESKHIKAVKEPWHQSNHYNALGQMLVTNQCLDKLAVACIDFTWHGMLKETCLSSVLADLHKCFIFLVIFLGTQNTFPSR